MKLQDHSESIKLVQLCLLLLYRKIKNAFWVQTAKTGKNIVNVSGTLVGNSDLVLTCAEQILKGGGDDTCKYYDVRFKVSGVI